MAKAESKPGAAAGPAKTTATRAAKAASNKTKLGPKEPGPAAMPTAKAKKSATAKAKGGKC